jgi:hypothetical protein
MDIAKIISQLKDERDRIDRAIHFLDGLATVRKRRRSKKRSRTSTPSSAAGKVTPITVGRSRLASDATSNVSEAQKERGTPTVM